MAKRSIGVLQTVLAGALVLAAVPEARSQTAVRVERVHERVFLVRDRPGTQTHFQMIVNAGCSDEANGDCRGLAHYLEHLVLIGRNPEHRDSAVKMFPDAYSNGWTNDRATGYVHAIPPREGGALGELETLFTFYAARLKDFSIDDAEAGRERRVVRQEHDLRIASQPFARFSRELNRQLLPDHPAGQWAIGTADTIDAFTLADAKAYHRTWYHLNNTYFFVRGDVDAARLKAIADKALAGLSPGQLPPRRTLVEPSLVAERKDVREENRSVRRAGAIVLKAVRIEEDNPQRFAPARTLLLSWLQSRLPGSPFDVVADQAKLTANTLSVGLRRVAPRTYVISLGADVAPGVAPEALRDALVKYLDDLATARLDAATLQRLKNRFADQRAMADRSPQQVAQRLTNWMADRNRFEDLDLQPARLAAVTDADIKTLLAGLAANGRVVTGILAPAGAAAVQGPSVPRQVSPGGIAYRHIQMSDTHQAIYFAWKGGLAAGGPGRTNLASLTVAMLLEGPKGMSRSQLTEEFRDLQANANLGATGEYIRGSLVAPAGRFAAAAALLARSINDPAMSPEALQRIAGVRADALRQGEEQPATASQQLAARLLLPPGVWRDIAIPDPVALSAVTLDEIEAFRRDHLVRDTLDIVVAGPAGANDVGPIVDALFAALPARGKLSAPEPPVLKAPGRTVVLERPVVQTIILAAGPAVLASGDERIRAEFAVAAFATGRGRLYEVLRGKLGATYGVSGRLQVVDRQTRAFVVNTAVANDKAAEALAALRAEYARVFADGFTEGEIAPLKTVALTRHADRIRRSAGRASATMDAILAGFADDYPLSARARVEAVTPAEVNDVLRRRFPKPPLTIVVIAPSAEGLGADCVIKAPEEIERCM